MSDTIFVSLSTFAEYGDQSLQALKDSGIPYYLNPLGRRVVKEEILEMGKDSTGIVAGVESYDQGVLEKLPALKCISRVGVGIESIDLDYANSRGIKIRNTPDVVIRPVAELTVAMIFDLMRKLTLHTVRMRKKEWKKSAGNLLAGKTVGILGAGRIGRKTAELLKMLDAKVIVSDIKPDLGWSLESGINFVEREVLLKECDILSLHISALAQNPFILDRESLDLMKNGTWVVNVSRGNIINENDVYHALKSGKLAGAAFDVFPAEPYSGKLCELENVVMTPHVATLTRESRTQMELEAVNNLIEELQS